MDELHQFICSKTRCSQVQRLNILNRERNFIVWYVIISCYLECHTELCSIDCEKHVFSKKASPYSTFLREIAGFSQTKNRRQLKNMTLVPRKQLLCSTSTFRNSEMRHFVGYKKT